MSNTIEIYRKEEKMKYKVIEAKIILEGDTQEKITYGLRHDSGTVFEDVSPNRETVERIAKDFTKRGLAPYQLEDVLMDMADTENGFEM